MGGDEQTLDESTGTSVPARESCAQGRIDAQDHTRRAPTQADGPGGELEQAFPRTETSALGRSGFHCPRGRCGRGVYRDNGLANAYLQGAAAAQHLLRNEPQRNGTHDVSLRPFSDTGTINCLHPNSSPMQSSYPEQNHN